MTPNTIPSFARSSVDPTQLSLTITSLGKALAGILTTIAILKGVDPALLTPNATTITEAAQNILVQYLAILPALYSAYHSAQAIFGVMRKAFVWITKYFKKGPTVVQISVPAQQ